MVIDEVIEAIVVELQRQVQEYGTPLDRNGDWIQIDGSFRLESLAAAMLSAAARSSAVAPSAMDDQSGLRLLTPPHDHAVIRMPHRRSAAVAFSRERLQELIDWLKEARSEREPEDMVETMGYQIAHLELILAECDRAAQADQSPPAPPAQA